MIKVHSVIIFVLALVAQQSSLQAQHKAQLVKKDPFTAFSVYAQTKIDKQLFLAAALNKRSKVKFLLWFYRANVNSACGPGKTTPLIIATSRGHDLLIKMLLKRKEIDVNAANEHDLTALTIAVLDGRLAMVSILLQDIRIRVDGDGGQTAFMRAAQLGFVQILQLLFENKAQIDMKNRDGGDTALIYAARAGSVSGVKFLVENSASLNMKNGRGETAIQVALSRKHGVIVRMLLSAGAHVDEPIISILVPEPFPDDWNGENSTSEWAYRCSTSEEEPLQSIGARDLVDAAGSQASSISR